MVDQIAVVQFTTPASPSTLDVTSPLITEPFSCAILIFSRSTTDDSNNTHGVMGIGFVSTEFGPSASANSCIAIQLENGVTVPDNNSDNSIAECIRASDGTFADDTTMDIRAAGISSVAGGFRINFTQTDVQAKCVAIIFAGLARSSTGFTTTTTAGASEQVGGSGSGAGMGFFTPDLVIFTSSDNAVNADHANGTVRLGFALNQLGIPMRSAYVNVAESDPTDADGVVSSTEAWSAFTGTTRTQIDGAVITAFDSEGFDLDADAGSPQASYLAIKFSGNVRLAIENLAVSGSGGVQTFNDFGFPPDLVFGMSTLLAAEDTFTDGPTASAAGYFVTGRHGSRAYSVHHQEGLDVNPATTVAATRQGDHAVLTLDHLGAVAQQASWIGASGSGGFQLNFSTATTGFLTALGIQLIPAAPIVRRPTRYARARAAIRRRLPFVPTRPDVSPPPLGRLLATVARMRRLARARLFRRPAIILTPTPEIGIEVEEGSKGRVTPPGAVRGTVAHLSISGRVTSPGAVRAATVGPGVSMPDEIL